MLKIVENSNTELMGIYLEHKRIVDEIQPKYELNENLFNINEPFYMKTEKEALIRDKTELNHKNNKNKRHKRLRNKRHLYESLLSEAQKQLINKIFNEVKHSINELSTNTNDNKECEQLAQKAQSINDFHEYSDQLLCNEHNFSVLLNDFIIPPNSSFMCSDVIHGLEIMQDHYIQGKFKLSQQFFVVIDPPWAQNKSVKRKRCYQTDDNQNILEMTKNLNSLLELFPKQTDIRVCIWSTHKEKEFVLNEMLPTLNCKNTHVFLWHKITRKGESCKLRGSLEYLIIGSKTLSEIKPQNGVIVSVPSAIHSHKPSLKQLMENLFEEKCVKSGTNDMSSAPEIVSNDSEPNSVNNQTLSTSIIRCVSGLELYARYLNSGVHSIGFESLKLQNLQIFAFHQK